MPGFYAIYALHSSLLDRLAWCAYRLRPSFLVRRQKERCASGVTQFAADPCLRLIVRGSAVLALALSH